MVSTSAGNLGRERSSASDTMLYLQYRWREVIDVEAHILVVALSVELCERVGIGAEQR